MIPADAPPSFDAHREGTFATVHSAAPFYSVLIRVDPNNPSSTTDFVCDLCAAVPQPTDSGRTYTFKIRDGVKFHDGAPLTAADVAASWNKIIHPPEGTLSPRESHYMMVDTVEALDPTTVVFHLKFATAAFLPAMADPFSWIYKKEILDKNPRWYEKNILGSGPFKFAAIETGQSIKGVKNPDYYHRGLPYLDGFTGIYADSSPGRGNPQRSCSDRVPRASTCRARRAGRRAGRQDHRARERLELRRDHRAQPQKKAIRRSSGAPRADLGDRPLAWRAEARQDR
jgi:peptide/nickel transport system substrate-binding protein